MTPIPSPPTSRLGASTAPLAPSVLAELFAPVPGDGGPAGFVLAGLRGGARLLWVQDRASRREGGRPCAEGVAERLTGGMVALLHLEVARAADALWAMEQALGCPSLTAVVGEVWGDPAALGVTATKRLALRARASGVRAWLIRRAATPGLSAARARWRVASLPSPPHPDDPHAPGEARWSAALLRSPEGRTGDRIAWRDIATGGLAFAAPGAEAVAEGIAPGGAPRLARWDRHGADAPPAAARARAGRSSAS